MANRFYDRERYDQRQEEEGRYGRGPRYGRDRYRRSDYGEYGSESYDRPYSGFYSETYNPGYGGLYTESYGARYDEPYDRGYSYETGYGDPYNRYTGYESRYSDPYYRNRDGRGGERGLLERAGDEVRSWFGDEDAERRRRLDQARSANHVGRGPRNYKRSDERIREDINDRLTDDYYLDASDIEVGVLDRAVTLTGRVNSREDKRRAEDIANAVSGVTDVSNQLRVSRVDQTQTAYTTAAETASAKRA
jgi:osmotically-inducible protein OsmY